MRRLFLIFLLLSLSSQAWGACFPSFPSFGRWQDGCGAEWWNNYSLTFYAPLDTVTDPLRLIKGTGAPSFTRATTATYVHPTTGLITSAASGQLRIESNGALIEGARTNLVRYSEQLNAASGWTNTKFTVTADNTTAPDGALTADLVTDDNTAGFHVIGRTQSGANVDNGAYVTASVYAKTGTKTRIMLAMHDSTTGEVSAKYNIATGQSLYTIVKSGSWANATQSIEDAGGGWYRCKLTAQKVGGTAVIIRVYGMSETINDSSYTGANQTFYLWGAQPEAGASASSYLSTTTGTVTRNASVLTEQTASNIDNTAGTVAFDWSPNYPSTDNAMGLPVLWNSGGLKAYYNASDYKIYFTDGTNTISSGGLSFGFGDTIGLAFSWGASGISIYKDGVLQATGETYTASALSNDIYIGSDSSSVNQSFSNIKKFRIWNRQFSSSEMANISVLASAGTHTGLLAFWGDSLTNSNYPSEVANELNRPFYAGYYGGATSTQILDNMVTFPRYFSDTTVLWMGRNNYTFPDTVKADVASAIDNLTMIPKRFIVLSVLNGEYVNEHSGESLYNTMIQLNSDLELLYPDNYIDIRAYLVSQYDPEVAQDVIDHAADIVPSSLRTDNIHLSSGGYSLVAQQVKSFIEAKGW